jgi:hypothetical protein
MLDFMASCIFKPDSNMMTGLTLNAFNAAMHIVDIFDKVLAVMVWKYYKAETVTTISPTGESTDDERPRQENK